MGRTKRHRSRSREKISRRHLMNRLDVLENLIKSSHLSPSRSRSPLSDKPSTSSGHGSRGRSPRTSSNSEDSVSSPTIRAMRRTLLEAMLSPRGVTPHQSNSTQENELVIYNDVELPEDVLEILGEDPNNKETLAVKLHDALASWWVSNVATGLPKDEISNNTYGSFNSHRATMCLILQVNIGENPLLKRFMKDISRSRPPKPRYSFTWNPAQVLDYLETVL